MESPVIFTKDGELYERDPRYENPLDAIVQHMVACKFSHEKIRNDLGVSEEFIVKAITPSEE